MASELLTESRRYLLASSRYRAHNGFACYKYPAFNRFSQLFLEIEHLIMGKKLAGGLYGLRICHEGEHFQGFGVEFVFAAGDYAFFVDE